MKKLTAIIAAAAIAVSCSSKPAGSPDFLHGSRLYVQFQEYYLRGDAVLADYNFFKAEAQFQKIDGVCNLSRIYIGRFVMDETGSDKASLEVAKKYAAAGKCEEENNTVAYLENREYDPEKLSEPYLSISKIDPEDMADKAESDKFDDITKTRLLRKAAINYIMSNPALSEEIAEKALAKDKIHGWSVNILRDLIIIKNSREQRNLDTKDIITRINLVKSQLIKK